MSRAQVSAQAPGRTPPPLRANRDFRLLWIGQALSDFGSAMTYLVLPLVLLRAGYSTSVAGTIGMAALLTATAARMPAGYLTDHMDPRLLMLLADLTRLGFMSAVALWTVFGRLPVALAVASVVAAQLGMEVFRPSQSTVLRRAVPVEQRGTAISLNQARSYAADIAAPGAAGLLMALSPGVPFTVDAATFAVSALCVGALTRQPPANGRRKTGASSGDGSGGGSGDGSADRERFLRRFTAGLRYLASERFMRLTAMYSATMNLVFQALVYALILGVGRGRGGAALVGTAMSAAAVTGLAGALATPFLRRRLRLRAALAAGPVMAALLLAVAWRSGSDLAFVASFSALCLMTPLAGSELGVIMSTSVPERIYGRALAARGFITELLQPLGPLSAGVLLSAFSLRHVAAVFVAAFAFLAALALLLPPPPEPAGA